MPSVQQLIQLPVTGAQSTGGAVYPGRKPTDGILRTGLTASSGAVCKAVALHAKRTAARRRACSLPSPGNDTGKRVARPVDKKSSQATLQLTFAGLLELTLAGCPAAQPPSPLDAEARSLTELAVQDAGVDTGAASQEHETAAVAPEAVSPEGKPPNVRTAQTQATFVAVGPLLDRVGNHKPKGSTAVGEPGARVAENVGAERPSGVRPPAAPTQKTMPVESQSQTDSGVNGRVADGGKGPQEQGGTGPAVPPSTSVAEHRSIAMPALGKEPLEAASDDGSPSRSGTDLPSEGKDPTEPTETPVENQPTGRGSAALYAERPGKAQSPEGTDPADARREGPRGEGSAPEQTAVENLSPAGGLKPSGVMQPTVSPGGSGQVLEAHAGGGELTAQTDSAPAGPTATRPPAAGADAAPLTEQIAGQLRALGSQPGQQIIVRLNPPEMGAVRVTLREEGERIHGVLEVENSQTLTQLQREAPALINRLADSGIELARLDVSLTGAPDRSPTGGFDSLFGDGASGRHEGGSYGSGRGDGFDSPDEPQASETTEAEAMLRGYVDDESVNVWR